MGVAVTRAFVLIGFCAVGAGCSTNDEDSESFVELELVELENRTGCAEHALLEGRGGHVIRDAEELDAALEFAHAPDSVSVDLDESVVVLASWGVRDCNEWTSVGWAREYEDRVEVQLIVHGFCRGDDGLCSPCSLTQIPLVDKPYVFVEEDVVDPAADMQFCPME